MPAAEGQHEETGQDARKPATAALRPRARAIVLGLLVPLLCWWSMRTEIIKRRNMD